jgi:hypothetical protein
VNLNFNQLPHWESCTESHGTKVETRLQHLNALTMSAEQAAQRKSGRTTWPPGHALALLGRRTRQETAAAKQAVEDEKLKKREAADAKAQKKARGIENAIEIEDVLAKAHEEAESTFPRRRSGMLNPVPRAEC